MSFENREERISEIEKQPQTDLAAVKKYEFKKEDIQERLEFSKIIKSITLFILGNVLGTAAIMLVVWFFYGLFVKSYEGGLFGLLFGLMLLLFFYGAPFYLPYSIGFGFGKSIAFKSNKKQFMFSSISFSVISGVFFLGLLKILLKALPDTGLIYFSMLSSILGSIIVSLVIGLMSFIGSMKGYNVKGCNKCKSELERYIIARFPKNQAQKALIAIISENPDEYRKLSLLSQKVFLKYKNKKIDTKGLSISNLKTAPKAITKAIEKSPETLRLLTEISQADLAADHVEISVEKCKCEDVIILEASEVSMLTEFMEEKKGDGSKDTWAIRKAGPTKLIMSERIDKSVLDRFNRNLASAKQNVEICTRCQNELQRFSLGVFLNTSEVKLLLSRFEKISWWYFLTGDEEFLKNSAQMGRQLDNLKRSEGDDVDNREDSCELLYLGCRTEGCAENMFKTYIEFIGKKDKSDSTVFLVNKKLLSLS